MTARRIVSAGLGYRIEGTAWRLGRHSRPDNVAACRQDLCGPDTLAAFYRKSAIESVGGFSPWAGDALTGIDLGLALEAAAPLLLRSGAAMSRPCRSQNGAPRARAFQRGRNAERLFWRWASSQAELASWAGHTALLTGECATALWRPSMIVQLAGRACGAMQAALSGRSRKRPKSAVRETSSVIAKPHFALASEHAKKSPSARVA